MLRVAAAAVIRDGRLLLVSKREAPEVFYLPGGKLEPDETPEACVRRELAEELEVTVSAVRPFAVVEELAALERVPMRMDVLLTEFRGAPQLSAEIVALRWEDARAERIELAPAVRRHVVPQLVAAKLL